MANRSGDKGKRVERQAVAMLKELGAHLIDVPEAMRMLGAGRKDDVGDLRVFSDTAIQVRGYAANALGKAVRSSATDALRQSVNGHVTHHLGLVPYPRSRAGSVQWIATAVHWPTDIEPVIEHATISRALNWVRADTAPAGFLAYPRTQRIGVLTGAEGPPVLFAPVEAWLHALEQARGAQVHHLRTRGAA